MQLSTGRLYLDAAATPATAILGHDLPQLTPSDEPTVRRMISSLAPGYNCVALAQSYASAARSRKRDLRARFLLRPAAS